MAENAERNVQPFDWTSDDEVVLAKTDRDPRSVARSAKLLQMRRCQQLQCDLAGNITPTRQNGAFICGLLCSGPEQAVDIYYKAVSIAYREPGLDAGGD